MPLISIETIASGAQLGLWHIEESVDELLNRYPSLSSEVSSYRSDARKLEKLAVYSLLFMMTGDTNLRISHNEAGKPSVNGWNISISHTKGYAAVILSKDKNVAIDIEHISPRVYKIADRFVRTDEDASTLESLLLHWSAKETIYKYFSESVLHFFDMRIHDIKENELWVDNLKDNAEVMVTYRFSPDYVLTFV